MSDTLFTPQPYSLDRAPSNTLVKRAERLTNFDGKLFGGWIVRAAFRQENKAARVALFAASLPGLVLEVPSLLVSHAIERRLEKRFIETAIEEYPHIEGPRDLSRYRAPQTLDDGTPKEYAQAVLEHPSTADLELSKNTISQETNACEA